MLRAQELGRPADWQVRAKHNRSLPDCDKRWGHTGAGASIGKLRFEMAARHGMKARTVLQQSWTRTVTLPEGKGKGVVVTCVIAREIDAPDGVKPIKWRLLTNREAAKPETAIELINGYQVRWEIEMLFDVLKNACRVEALQMG
jgi:hypothetical protein